eukprot:527673-Amphidinium_carterae.1
MSLTSLLFLSSVPSWSEKRYAVPFGRVWLCILAALLSYLRRCTTIVGARVERMLWLCADEVQTRQGLQQASCHI